MHRTLAVVLFGLSLSIQSHVVFAESAPATLNYKAIAGAVVDGFPSPVEACQYQNRYFYNPPTYVRYSYNMDVFGGPTYNQGSCWYSVNGQDQEYQNWWGRAASCPQGGNITDSGGQNPQCVCPAGHDLDPVQICVDSGCPIDNLLPLPTDACSRSLEAGGGRDVSGACPCAEVVRDLAGEQCLAAKLRALPLPYNGPTSTIRNIQYQAHLFDLWNKIAQHNAVTDPTVIAACAEKKRIANQHNNDLHGLGYKPVGGSHNDGLAFDVSGELIDHLGQTLFMAGLSVESFLLQPPTCNLKWGGKWDVPDKFHFQLLRPAQPRYCN